MLKKLILDLLYPPVCMLCHRLLDERTGVCADCLEHLQWITGPRCMCCGKPLLNEGTDYCSDGESIRREFTAGIGVFPYRSSIRKAVLDLKDKGKKENAAFLGACMAAAIRPLLLSWDPKCLIPIPLTAKKRRIRGYNQAELLADALGGCLNLPVRTDILQRRHSRKEQKRLHRFARKRNQAETFYVTGKEIPASVLLVDDIYTTGNTLEAAARTLKAAGVRRVYFVTVCMGTDFKISSMRKEAFVL